MLLFGWRGALIFVGLLGIPVAVMILWQSRILIDQAPHPQSRAVEPERGAGLLLSRSVLMFLAFFMVSSMAGAGIQSWLITILHQVHGVTLATASSALTGYMVGQIGGVLLGGWWPTAPLATCRLSWF
jgi:MFS transporter, FSR family, fosmidomycin resistance protein